MCIYVMLYIALQHGIIVFLRSDIHRQITTLSIVIGIAKPVPMVLFSSPAPAKSILTLSVRHRWTNSHSNLTLSPHYIAVVRLRFLYAHKIDVTTPCVEPRPCKKLNPCPTIATFESMAPNIGSEPAEEKPANTGRTKIVVAGVPKPKKADVKPQTSSISPQTSSLPVVRLVVYTTKRGEQAPRIEGFGGENDPRWKRHYDDKVRLAKEKKEADAFNEKLQAKMKGKPKAEREKLRKQWKSVGSDPFGASYFTDRTTGDKYYQMTMGAKYMDVARDLVDAYNSGDEQAVAAAEQAVIDCKNGIVKDIEAQRDAERAEREAKKNLTHDPSPKGEGSMNAEEQAMFDLFKKFMAGDKEAMAKVGAVLNKAA